MSNFHPLEVVGCGSESQLQMGENLNKLSRRRVNMSIICEHVHRLELLKSFSILGCCGNVASVPKTLFISYSCMSYFGHVCLKLDILLLSIVTGECASKCVNFSGK